MSFEMFLFTASFFLIFSIKVIFSESNTTDENYNIYNDLLLSGYNPKMRPSNFVYIKVSFSLKQIVSIDEKNQIMTSNSYVAIEWIDPRLIWNPLDYGNITKCLAPASSLWIVDLFVINSASAAGGYINIPSQVLALLRNDGLVYVILSLTNLQTRCKIDVKHYPFDTQKCSVIVAFV